MSNTTLTAPDRVLPAVRVGATSWRWNGRSFGAALLLAGVLVLIVLLDVAKGEVDLSLAEVFRSLTGAGTVDGDVVVYDLRLPQTAVALLAGGALAGSGAIVQTLARNPLASPDVIGINAGAAVGAVSYMMVRSASTGEVGTGFLARAALPACAFVGAVSTALLLLALARKSGVLDSHRLILVGIGIAAALAAVTGWFLVTARLQSAADAQIWLTGSLNNRGWLEATPVLGALLFCVPLALLLGQTLNVMQLGPDSAQGLGVRYEAAQLVLLLAAVALAATAVAAVGPLGFVAFVAPQIARRLTGTARPPLISSILVGAILVVAANLISRVLLPEPLAAGIVTSLIGAPYFLYLLLRHNERRSA